MSESGYVGANTAKVADIINALNLSEENLEQADSYLLQSNYLGGTQGSLERARWLKPAGVDFLEREMGKRIPLSLTSEQILRLAIDIELQEPQTEFVGMREICEQLEITSEEYREATQALGDEGLIESRIPDKSHPFIGFTVTTKGRNMVRRGFRRKSMDTRAQLNIGAIFQGDVVDTDVLAIAQAHHSNIEQAITNGNSDDLPDEIENILEDLLKIVDPSLSSEQYTDYVDLTRRLSQEIQEEEPEPSNLHEILSVLNFAATMDGAIEFGRKALELYVEVAPLMMPLYQAILALVH